MSFFSKILGIDRREEIKNQFEATVQTALDSREKAISEKNQTQQIAADNKKYVQYGAIMLAAIIVIVIIIYLIKRNQ